MEQSFIINSKKFMYHLKIFLDYAQFNLKDEERFY